MRQQFPYDGNIFSTREDLPPHPDPYALEIRAIETWGERCPLGIAQQLADACNCGGHCPCHKKK